MESQNIEVALSPAIYPQHHNSQAIVVIADIFRATSAMCTAFINGAQSIIPVGALEIARAYKEKGFIVAAERDGIKQDFADFGNSPFNFTRDRVLGKTIVYSTTNGTQCVEMSKDCHKVLFGAFINITAITRYIAKEKKDVVILCAGWKNRFSLEDTIFAGALADQLIKTGYTTICDATLASIDLWDMAKPDLLGYLQKAAQRERLRRNKLDDVIEYCLMPDLTNIVPLLEDIQIVPRTI